MSGGRRLSEVEKPGEEDDASGTRGSGSMGWGIRSARPLNLKEIESKRKEDEGRTSEESQNAVEDTKFGHGDEKSRHNEKGRKFQKKEKASESSKQFTTNIQGHESEEIENFEFVNFKDLPKLPKIDSDVKGQFVGSSHKFERPIAGFRIRVRLLKYPSFSERAKWPGDLLVLEDRVFCWQEKVFSKSEADKYIEKNQLKTELDQQYHNEITENPGSKGTYLHSYIDSDYFVIRQEEKTLVRKCPASHFKTQTKFSATSAELKSVNSEGESVYGRDSDSDENSSIIPTSIRRKGQPSTSSKKVLGLKNRSEQEEHKQAEKQKKEEEKSKKEADEQEARRQKIEETELKEASKKSKKQLEAEQKQNRLDEQIKREQEAKDSALKKYLGTKRPSVAISARMLTTQSPTKRFPQRIPKTSKKKLRETASEDRKVSSSMDEDERDLKHSDHDTLGSDYKIQTGQDKEKRPRGSRKPDSFVGDDDGEYEKLERQSGPSKRSPSSKATKSTWTTRPIWRVAHRRFLERSGLQPPQSMYIMATIPHMNRRNREIAVCTIKAYPKSGIVVLKPLFGYRIVEAKRNHVYRLSWELDSNETQDAVKDIEKTFSRINQNYSTSVYVQRNSTLDDMGILFEMVPLNEIKLVVMGEIVSAVGFEAEPVCVHYLVEMPKGWRNDSVASDLQGITHNSFTTDEGMAHFSHDFFCQLAFSMDSVDQEDTYLRPMILIMVVALGPSGRVRYEGYAYITIPSTPGSHVIKVQTWKPKARSTMEKMQNVFLDVSPSLQDIHAVHIPVTEHEECRRANRLGLQTEPSGFVKVRLNVIHQVPTSYRDQSSKLELLEKMSSATIIKSVQAVIEAFQRARKRALNVKNNSSFKDTSHVL